MWNPGLPLHESVVQHPVVGKESHETRLNILMLGNGMRGDKVIKTARVADIGCGWLGINPVGA